MMLDNNVIKYSAITRLRRIAKTMWVEMRQPVPGHVSQRKIGKIRWRLEFIVKKYGWKIFALVIVYYLVRDTTLYIIIPFLVARHMFSR